MRRFNPDELALSTGGVWQSGNQPERITGFCFDARQIQVGECFVALSSGARDGHEFIGQAVQGGASAVMVERTVDATIPQLLVDDSLLALGAIGTAIRGKYTRPIVGITGSCGKTSTKEMLRLLLGETRTHATAGNWNNRIGVPMTLMGLNAADQDFAVIEAGINQPDEMRHLGEMIRADLTLVTNIGPAHLELLGTIENIATEKARLAQHATSDSSIILTAEVLRIPAFQKLSARAIVLVEQGVQFSGAVRRVIFYRIESNKGAGVKLYLSDGEMEAVFSIASPSLGIATNAALAIVVARELGVTEEDIRERIESWSPTSNRGRIVSLGGQTFYVDCYNANPASMRDALSAFIVSVSDELPRAYVLGAMNELGPQAETLHWEIGHELSLRPQDRAFFVGPKVLTDAYYSGAMASGARPDQLQSAETIEKIKSIIAEFSGALFLKGSRSYGLEKLLPVNLP
jgi:UDP-N-acetylmuramoyl-tripeptide--D-alanyl-D-alanine ligase